MYANAKKAMVSANFVIHFVNHSKHDPYASASELSILSIWHFFSGVKSRLYIALILTFPHTLIDEFENFPENIIFDVLWPLLWLEGSVTGCLLWMAADNTTTYWNRKDSKDEENEKGKFVARQYKLPFFQQTIDFSSYE